MKTLVNLNADPELGHHTSGPTTSNPDTCIRNMGCIAQILVLRTSDYATPISPITLFALSDRIHHAFLSM